jgi:hypothetical protein
MCRWLMAFTKTGGAGARPGGAVTPAEAAMMAAGERQAGGYLNP